MKPKRYLIPTLVAAGFGATDEAQAAFTRATIDPVTGPDNPSLLRVFTFNHAFTLAQHRSHSSHSSHRSSSGGGHYSHTSHTSHRSSTGGYGGSVYTSPSYPVPATPVVPAEPAPTRAPRPLYSPPSERASPPTEVTSPRSLSGRSDRFKSIVRRVQIALMARSFYQGEIDGVVGPGLRAALRGFQASASLEVTGTITPQTLDALRISSD
jgi:His-Xaa-Ser repeat protein HxsA